MEEMRENKNKKKRKNKGGIRVVHGRSTSASCSLPSSGFMDFIIVGWSWSVTPR